VMGTSISDSTCSDRHRGHVIMPPLKSTLDPS
jgi:hypothetical protein